MQVVLSVLESAPARRFIAGCTDAASLSCQCAWRVFDQAFLPADPSILLLCGSIDAEASSRLLHVDCRHCEGVIRAAAVAA